MTTLTVNNKKIYFFLKKDDILAFLDFLYLLQTLQYIFIILTILFYLDSIKNILFCHSFYSH